MRGTSGHPVNHALFVLQAELGTGQWLEKVETVKFADFQFTVTRHYLKHPDEPDNREVSPPEAQDNQPSTGQEKNPESGAEKQSQATAQDEDEGEELVAEERNGTV